MSKKLTNEEFINRLNGLNKGYISLDEYKGIDIPIRFQCKYGHIWKTTPSAVLNKGSECHYCTGEKVLVGFNDLWTTNPEVAKLLKDPSDGYKYSSGSNKKVEFICSMCGNIIKVQIYKVTSRGLCCQKCSDGVSYPNKFARAFLDQLPIKSYIPEYHPNWAKPYSYDNYFEYNGIKYIMEMDGGLHYRKGFCFNKSLEERQIIDNIKNNLAFQNGIQIIRINCMKSEREYIKNSILSSELNNIFDLSSIDWDLCDKTSQKSLVKQTCELYSCVTTKLDEIANILHINKATVRQYVKIGTKYGWCNYDPDVAKKNSNNPKAMSVTVLNIDHNYIHTFKSIRVCQTEIKQLYNINVTREGISNSCKTHKPYKGFNFRFANETIQN